MVPVPTDTLSRELACLHARARPVACNSAPSRTSRPTFVRTWTTSAAGRADSCTAPRQLGTAAPEGCRDGKAAHDDRDSADGTPRRAVARATGLGPRFSDVQVERRTQTPPPVLTAVKTCERLCWATSIDPWRQDVRSPRATSIPSRLAVTDCAPWLSAISVGAEGQATCGPVAAKEQDALAHCGPHWMTDSGSRNADSARIQFLATDPILLSDCYAPHSEDSSPAGWYGRVRDQTQ